MAIAAMILQAVGGVADAHGAYYGAKSQKLALGFQADMDDINASLSETAAQRAVMAGQREEQSSRLNTANIKSKQRVAMAAGGIDLGEGSALNVLTGTDLMGEVDAKTIAQNAVTTAWGYRTQAVNDKISGMMKRSAAKGINPAMSAATSLLGSATKVAGSWYGMNKVGAA